MVGVEKRYNSSDIRFTLDSPDILDKQKNYNVFYTWFQMKINVLCSKQQYSKPYGPEINAMLYL
jgi:hypothetical protein